MINIDYSILVSVLGQGYIRCLNNLTASRKDGPQFANMLRNIINKFTVISYENLDEILSLLKNEDFDLIGYLVKKELEESQKSLLHIFSMVNRVETKQLLSEKPYHVGYHFNDSSAVISYKINPFNVASAGAQFVSYLAMLKILVGRIDNPYAFSTLILFMITTDINISRFGGYDSLTKMRNIILATCTGVHGMINGRVDGKETLDSKDKIAILIKNNPEGFMFMTAGIPEY